MKRIYLSSNILHSVGYDPINEVLEIEFLSGEVYQYFDVPHSILEDITGTTYHTTHIHDWICNIYQCKKIEYKISD